MAYQPLSVIQCQILFIHIYIYIYIYILNIYDLVWFYSISTLVGYSMPNPLYTYIYISIKYI